MAITKGEKTHGINHNAVYGKKGPFPCFSRGLRRKISKVEAKPYFKNRRKLGTMSLLLRPQLIFQSLQGIDQPSVRAQPEKELVKLDQASG